MDLLRFFDQLKEVRVGVIGDLFLDLYIIGSVHRISPEAPVPVLSVEQSKEMLGGAGNALLGMIALGLKVSFFGRVGEDLTGCKVREFLHTAGVDTDFLVTEKKFMTPQKHRMVASNQQLLRVDYEELKLLSDEVYTLLQQSIESFLNRIDILAISDYNKGLLIPELTTQLIQRAREKKIDVIVDPKGVNYSKYQNATLIKPNLNEAYIASGCDLYTPLKTVAKNLLDQVACDFLVITQSEKGMTLFSQNSFEELNIPAYVHEVKDVTGAGDTVLAMLVAAISQQLDPYTAMSFANIAASIAVGKVGCAQVTSQEFIDCHTHLRKVEQNPCRQA